MTTGQNFAPVGSRSEAVIFGSPSVSPEKGKSSEKDRIKKDRKKRKSKKKGDEHKSGKSDDDEDGDEEENVEPVSYFKLFRFADKVDALFIFLGTLCAIAHGALMPLLGLYFSDLTTRITGQNPDQDAIFRAVRDIAEIMAYLGTGLLFASFFKTLLLEASAIRQIAKMKKAYVTALLRKDMAWYDLDGRPMALTSRIASDLPKIEKAIGKNYGLAVQSLVQVTAGLVIGFFKSWLMALVIVATLPLMFAGVMGVSWVVSKGAAIIAKGYGKAAGIAAETMQLHRVVTTFMTQPKEHVRYTAELNKSSKALVKMGAVSGTLVGFLNFSIFVVFAVSLLFAFQMVSWERVDDAGQALAVLFCIFIGMFGLVFAGPAFENFAEARGAGAGIIKVLDHTPDIDNMSTEGLRPETSTGAIGLHALSFAYPTAPQVQVLDALSIEIKPQQTIAFVGHSGCGKSTTFQLLERFYDPGAGTVTYDGTDIKSLNIQWFRDQVALVSQMPTLFPYSIRDNIGMGARVGHTATDDEIVAAAKLANAHEFIMSFPDQYDTLVGDMGSQLSGGQKQRIAIARAMIKQPKVLLLDEATSALDNESEHIVQQALNGVATMCTTIVIAHRLSTVHDADLICVFDHGRIVEKGTHAELVAAKGQYNAMLEAQKIEGEEIKGEKKATLRQGKRESGSENRILSKRKSADSVAGDGGPDAGGRTATEDVLVPGGPTLWIARQSWNQKFRLASGAFFAAIEGAVFGIMGLIIGQIIPLLALASYAAFVYDDNTRLGIRGDAGRFIRSFVTSDFPPTSADDLQEAALLLCDPARVFQLYNASIIHNETDAYQDEFIDFLSTRPPNDPLAFADPATVEWKITCNSTKERNYEVMSRAFNEYRGRQRFAIFKRSTTPKPDTVFVNSSPFDTMVAWFIIYIAMGITIMAAGAFKGLFISLAGASVVRAMRTKVYWAFLNQPSAYHDSPAHSKAFIADTLSADCQAVRHAFIDLLSASFMTIGALVAGLAVSFYYSWAVSLFLLMLTPIIVMAQMVQMAFMTGKDTKEAEPSSVTASLAITNIKTVFGLNRAMYFRSTYAKQIDGPRMKLYRASFGKALSAGVSDAFSQFYIFAATFVFAVWLATRGQVELSDVLSSIFGLLFGAQQAGNAFVMAGDRAGGIASVKKIFGILQESDERLSQPDDSAYKGRMELLSNLHQMPEHADKTLSDLIDVAIDENPERGFTRDDFIESMNKLQILKSDDLHDETITDPVKFFKGEIEFRNVVFTYPERPDITVLKGVSFKARPGETVALVGGSGSGKSTIIALIERFYEPDSGEILFDGINIKDIHPAILREHVGLVAQEPMLFGSTIKDNITYGVSDDTPMSLVIQAAKDANAYDFIMEQHNQFDTSVALSGESLSGGQRQRIAIARCLVRGTKVKALLLDEATSALDAVNEKIVQDALDKASQGRTTITIAHRLSTIQHSDRIIVMEQGTIVEEGTHEELLAMTGAYYNLVNAKA